MNDKGCLAFVLFIGLIIIVFAIGGTRYQNAQYAAKYSTLIADSTTAHNLQLLKMRIDNLETNRDQLLGMINGLVAIQKNTNADIANLQEEILILAKRSTEGK